MARFGKMATLQGHDPRIVPGQTKFTEDESADIDWAVEFFRSQGVKATRSSLIRAAVLDTVEALKEEHLSA